MWSGLLYHFIFYNLKKYYLYNIFAFIILKKFGILNIDENERWKKLLVVENLTKVYRSRNRQGVKALDHISFTLPNKGLVFLTGKSGSGKSTLLNLIGGIDEITSGDIIADGNKLSLFSSEDYDCYRNSYLGFVFQDFCLLDDLTVEQNIEIVLDLQKKPNKGLIEYTLERVGMGGYSSRYPRELSGGQKQRIAIARALVKNPKLILADEPTGNLDSKSAEQVLLLLKELSKHSLIIIVSHNLDDAYKYGDRIIELEDGKIILDVQRSDKADDKGEVVDGNLFLPYGRKLGNEELENIKKEIVAGKVKNVIQRDNTFTPAIQPKNSPRAVNMTKSCLPISKSLKLSGLFLKRRRLSFLLTTVIVTCLIVLLGLCQFFYQFDFNYALTQSLINEQEEDLIIYNGKYYDDNKRYIVTDNLIELTDSDIEKLKSGGYSSDIYKIYNFAMVLGQSSNAYSSLLEEGKVYDNSNLRDFYARQTYGTIVCDLDYLTNVYGVDGKLSYIGDLEEKSYGLIITDYVADSIIYFNNKEYSSHEDIIGKNIYSGTISYRGYVNAIIDTDYEEKYAILKERLMNEYDALVTQNKESQVIKTDAFLDFAQYVRHYLGMGYSINEYWYLDSVTYESRNFVKLDYTTIESDLLDEDYYLASYSAYPDVVANKYSEISLATGECAMKLSEYNRIFGTTYNNTTLKDFEPHTIKINRFPKSRNAFTDPRVSRELTITKLLPNSSSFNLVLSVEDFNEFRKADTFCFGGVFENIDEGDKLYNATSTNPYFVDSGTYKAISTIFMIVSIFKDFFLLITIGLCVVAVLLIMSFAAGNVRKRKFEIGVIKAMGGRTSELSSIFVLQVAGVGALICILSSLLLYFVTSFVDGMISAAMIKFLSEVTELTINIINFDSIVMIVDIAIIISITLLSALIPLFKLHKIKPINIMRHKD